MVDPTEPDRVRVALGDGQTVELDGGTVLVAGEPSPSVLLRLAPWRAMSLSRTLGEWSDALRIFHRVTRSAPDEMALSLGLAAAAVAAGEPDTGLREARGPRRVRTGERLAAVALLGELEPGLSPVQRMAVVDAAAWWLGEERGGPELAYAVLDAACSSPAATERVYLTLITRLDPGPTPDDR